MKARSFLLSSPLVRLSIPFELDDGGNAALRSHGFFLALAACALLTAGPSVACGQGADRPAPLQLPRRSIAPAAQQPAGATPALTALADDVDPAAARADDPNSAPIQLPPRPPTAADFERSLRARYDLEEGQFTLEDQPDGPRGRFMLRGDLTPEAARAPEVVDAGPRAIAQAFLEAEAANFGLARVDELRESGLSTTSLGWTSVSFQRYVGALPLEDAQVVLSIDPDGVIRSVSGSLVPLPRGLFEAARRPTLSEDEVAQIGVADLIASGDDPNEPRRFSKVAIPSPPYVVLKVRGAWNYTIDAFTGEILEKTYGLRHERQR